MYKVKKPTRTQRNVASLSEDSCCQMIKSVEQKGELKVIYSSRVVVSVDRSENLHLIFNNKILINFNYSIKNKEL